nr:branched-chain amino acid aminotransferase [Neobacillus sp. Marseille-Q6967]
MARYKETDFVDAYIERCSKETETMIGNESGAFLNQPISYLKTHKNEFIYLESKWFEEIGVEGVSLEVDDVFGTYDVMLGLKLQKKLEKPLKEFLDNHLQGDEAKFDLMFSHEDGLWDLNFALNFVDGFEDHMSINEAYQLIYRFLSQLVETAKNPNG